MLLMTQRRISAIGTKLTSHSRQSMSAFGVRADIVRRRPFKAKVGRSNCPGREQFVCRGSAGGSGHRLFAAQMSASDPKRTSLDRHPVRVTSTAADPSLSAGGNATGKATDIWRNAP